MQCIISTDGAFYRHYLRVRRWFGVNEEPAKRGGLCKPCHTILWGTLFTAVTAPFIGIGWLVAKAFDRVSAGGGGVIMRGIGGCRMSDGRTWASGTGTREFTAQTGAGLGILVLCSIVIVGFLSSLLGLGLWNVSDVSVWIRDAAMMAGYCVFTIFAGFGGFLNWLWDHLWDVIIIVSTATTIVLVVAGFLWFLLNTRLGATLFIDPAKGLWASYKMRRSLRRAKPAGKLSRLLCGHVVAGKMHVMGAGSIVLAFICGLAKGSCPLVEFLSPEEQRRRGRRA